MRNDVTSANAVSERKKSFRTFDFFSFAVWTNIKTKKERQTTKQKNIAGQVLTYNSKNFHWLNKKLDRERTMNGLGKPFRKKSDPKNRKNCKNQSEIAACEQKSEFCSNTVLSLYFKFRAKHFTPQNHSLFCSTSCFGVTKITNPIWLQKSWKCVNRSLKKRQRPNTIQILWIVKKNQEHRNIASLSLQLCSYKKIGAL